MDRAGGASQTPKSALGICAMTYYRSTGAPVDRGHTPPCNRTERTKAPVTKGVHERLATQSLPPTIYRHRRPQHLYATRYSTAILIAIAMVLASPPHMPPPPSTTTRNPLWSNLRPEAEPFTPGASEHRRNEQPYNRTPPQHPTPTTSQTRQHHIPSLIPPPPSPTTTPTINPPQEPDPTTRSTHFRENKARRPDHRQQNQIHSTRAL